MVSKRQIIDSILASVTSSDKDHFVNSHLSLF